MPGQRPPSPAPERRPDSFAEGREARRPAGTSTETGAGRASSATARPARDTPARETPARETPARETPARETPARDARHGAGRRGDPGAGGAAGDVEPDDEFDDDPDDQDLDDDLDDDDRDDDGPGDRRDAAAPKRRRRGSFWRELPLLILVAFILTFAIQTFVARIYVIPSQSMEQTLIGCTGCTNDRVAVDKVSYRLSDPSPGDVVVFAGPPAWRENDEVDAEQPSSNVLVRGLEDLGSLVGLGSTGEKDFVKRVIAVGGQTVACCDAQHRVTVDGKPLNESYLYFQPGTPGTQEPFAPVQVPAGQLWVMGDNRNNSADSRYHGTIGVSDVIGKARLVVLPVSRWTTVPAIDPQATPVALAPLDATGPGWGGVAVLVALPLAGRLDGSSVRRREQGPAPRRRSRG